MKKTMLFFTLIVTSFMVAQNVNTKKGYAAEGYDVVAYFTSEAKEGKKNYTTTYDSVNYKFSSEKNLKTFVENPSKFVPQYGGYCAYAVAKSGKKVGINPKSFQIKDNKLYLFYATVFADTLEKWNEEGPDALQKNADANWENIVMKKN